MHILENDTADFSIEIKNLDNLYIVKVTESKIGFVYDGKRYILSKDDPDDDFITLYKAVSKDTLREISTQVTSLEICLLVRDSSNSDANKEYFARMLTKLEFATGMYESEYASKKAELEQIHADMMMDLDSDFDPRIAKFLEVCC
jgi:hypothetical protein